MFFMDNFFFLCTSKEIILLSLLRLVFDFAKMTVDRCMTSVALNDILCVNEIIEIWFKSYYLVNIELKKK